MKLAQIKSGVVVNVIEVNPKAIPDFAKGWPDAKNAGTGWGFDGEAFIEPKPDMAAILAQERATMACTPMQGILTLGEANWNTILAYRETTSWQEKVIIDSAQTWVRNSQDIAFFQYLLSFTDTQVDDLFRAAMLVG
jgi:hypothetical protein